MASTTEDFNLDELEAPQWLDINFFNKVLRKCQDDMEIQVKSFVITPGTGKGDHYASVMFRTVVDYQQKGTNKTISMIIKAMPDVDGFKKDMLSESHLFKTEIDVYTEIIPKFEKILRSVGDNTVLAGRCLYHSLSPIELIVFEDLCPLGYVVTRDRTLSLDAAKMAYMKLAKFHAISYKLNLENPRSFDKYCHNLFGLTNMMKSDMWTDGIRNFIKMLERTPGLDQYKPYFEAIRPNLLDECAASFDEYRKNPQKDTYYVLAHGDFHSKNMMFKHCPASGNIEDVMLLDFQLSNIGPIAIDLLYSFTLILNGEQRANHKDEIIYYYFSIFRETLKKIGFSGRQPKLNELRSQLMKHKSYELFLMTSFLPGWYALSEGENDIDAMIASDDYRRKFYDNQNFVKEMQSVLPKMLHLGYFDN